MDKKIIYTLKCHRCNSVFHRNILSKPNPKTGQIETACCWGGCNGLASVIKTQEIPAALNPVKG